MSRLEADALAALRRRASRLATLVESSGALAETLDLAQVLQATSDGVCRLAGFDTAAVYLLEDQRLRLGATTPALPPDFPEALRVAALADHPHIGRALSSGGPILLPDARAAALTDAERAAVVERGLRTILYVPMIARDKEVGVLIVADATTSRPLEPEEVDLARAHANLAALAVENARLFASAQEHARETARQSAEARRVEAERLALERQLLHAQKLESLGVLSGGVAHDFNNLLQAMLGNLDLALPALASGSPEREAVERAAAAARRATDLTRQLLAYSGRGSFLVRPLELSALVRESAGLFRAAVPHTCAIALDLAAGLPAIQADAGQVQQVVMNLITNAADAVGARPGTLTVRTSPWAGGAAALQGSRVAVAAPADRYVALEVEDDGCGMDAATVERIFDPFFSTKGVGRGLGLSALLGIVRGHAGALFVESQPGRGTRFRVLFPAAAAASEQDHPAAAVPAPTEAPPGAVLVVDDEDMVRKAGAAMVRALKRPALEASGGREAVELLRARRGEIRFVLLDLSMPGMDGMETLDALRAIDPDVRVILSSGYDEQALLGGRYGAGLASFLQKPYSLTQLREALAKAAAG